MQVCCLCLACDLGGRTYPFATPACSSSSGHCASIPTSLQGQGRNRRQPNTAGTVSPFIFFQSQRPSAALAIGGALARPAWLSSPTLGRANRFLSTAAVSLMNPRRPLGTLEKIKVLTLRVEQRTREDSEYPCWVLAWPRCALAEWRLPAPQRNAVSLLPALFLPIPRAC